MNPDEDNDDLINELNGLLERVDSTLDSTDKTAQAQSATILSNVSLNNKAGDEAGQPESSMRQGSKARFQARQARKTAVLMKNQPAIDHDADARLKREAELEEKTIKRICEELDLRIHEINADGHCLYSAVADQLALLSIIPPSHATYTNTRLVASNYIWSHPEDFLLFLPDESSSSSGLMSPRSFEQYCAAIRETSVWGGEPEILALSRAFNVPIHVVQGTSPPVIVHNPVGAPADGDITDKEKKVVRISYHRKMYGLGEHYNSLRPKGNVVKNTLQTILR